MGSRSTKSGYVDCSKRHGIAAGPHGIRSSFRELAAYRLSRFLDELTLARDDSSYPTQMMPIRSSLIAVRPPVWHGLFEDLEPAVPDDQDDGVVDRVAVGIERE